MLEIWIYLNLTLYKHISNVEAVWKKFFSSMMKENFNIFHFNLFEKTAIQNYSFEFHTCSSQKKIHRNEDFNCNLFEYSSSSLSTGCSSWKSSEICREIDSAKIAKSTWLTQGLRASKLHNPWKNYYCLNFSSSTCIW